MCANVCEYTTDYKGVYVLVINMFIIFYIFFWRIIIKENRPTDFSNIGKHRFEDFFFHFYLHFCLTKCKYYR